MDCRLTKDVAQRDDVAVRCNFQTLGLHQPWQADAAQLARHLVHADGKDAAQTAEKIDPPRVRIRGRSVAEAEMRSPGEA